MATESSRIVDGKGGEQKTGGSRWPSLSLLFGVFMSFAVMTIVVMKVFGLDERRQVGACDNVMLDERNDVCCKKYGRGGRFVEFMVPAKELCDCMGGTESEKSGCGE